MSNRIKESNITPGAVTSDKIAPGTISASNISPGTITGTQIATDTIASSNIAPGTIANDRLANTEITINGTTIALGASGDIVAGTDWQSVVVADGSTGTTASAGEGYFIDTTSAAHTITLPADGSSTIGDTIIIRDYAGTFATNNVTLTSTAKISGADADGTLSTNDLVVTVVYVDSTKGWVTIENEAKAVGATDTAYISATGGTVTTSGDYKIHTFTGDGCFVVSTGNTGDAPGADYLVVAGGGGGGQDVGGAGGAGGFRYSNSTFPVACAPAAPLANPTGLTVTAQTYPITVGGGGAGGNQPTPTERQGSQGSSSIFSTITSAGGGGGGGSPAPNNGISGGSGGGAGRGSGSQGSGNTPPVSPPQGQDGGNSGPTCGHAGGGGGAIVAGTSGNTTPGTPGVGQGGNGAGLPNAFGTSGQNCGSYYYFSGGGSGGIRHPIANDATKPGGLGGGGTSTSGSPPVGNSSGGTANTGGGAGGSGSSQGVNGASGGKGIVIIRYKYQN